MFLRSMEMFGFKSFPDRTNVKFEPGITVFVGPNGCGKSNIVDAIKWVLGEKLAKNIRGSKMEDIIFTGTDQRKPLSLAEVSVTIDNSEKILDIESDTVSVGRRLFRDGESEYLINKSPVRLKDVEKLFMDTGIGKSAYSVMEQGKMDLILSTRAEDRRYLFEEAAGISRYKLQKKESLRRLTETGENFKRINDIIKEIEREKDLKSKQAETTKEYLGFKSEHLDLDIKINVIKYKIIIKKQEKLENDVERFKKEKEKISVRVSKTSAENEKDEKKKNDIQHQLFELEKRLHAYKIRLEDIDLTTEKNRKEINEQQARKRSVQKDIDDRLKSLDKLNEDKKKSELSGVEIKKSIENDKKNLTNFVETRKRKMEYIQNLREKIKENKKGISQSEETLKSLRDSLEVVIKKLIDEIEERKAELQDSEKERQEVRNRIDEGLKILEDSLKKLLLSLESGKVEDAPGILKSIELESLRKDINIFEEFEDGFRSILFDKTGIHAEKEGIDKNIKREVDLIEKLRSENIKHDDDIHKGQQELADVNDMIVRVEKDLSKNENESDWIEKHLESLVIQMDDVRKLIDNFKEDIVRSDKIIKNLENEINEWNNRLVEFNERSESLMKDITELTENRSEIEKKILNRKSISRNDDEELKKLVEKISNLDKLLVEHIFKRNAIEDYLWTEYEKKIPDYLQIKADESQYSSIQEEIQKVKDRIQDLGPINNLAIEEFKDLKKRFEYYINQKKDIEKAREDILSVIEDINKTSVDLFISTFDEIQKNFSDVFKRLFSGGEASLKIIDLENVLESGIDIMVRPPGKKPKNINLLSGGERALTAIALLFATYMVKPSPFCFLDEIDAPLDEENIGRFIKMLKEFARGTQFIIVSHNKKTMSIGESLYGITMEEPGTSKVVSLKMKNLDPVSVS